MFRHTFSDIINSVVNSKLKLEKITEPDSRKKHKGDPWYNLWEFTPKLMNNFPPTIILKARK